MRYTVDVNCFLKLSEIIDSTLLRTRYIVRDEPSFLMQLTFA